MSMAVQLRSMQCNSPLPRFIRHWFRGRVRLSLVAAVAATASALRSRTTHVESFSRATHTAREHESAPLYVGWRPPWQRQSGGGEAIVRQWPEEAERAILRCITPTAAAHDGQHTGAHRHRTTRCSAHMLIDDTGCN